MDYHIENAVERRKANLSLKLINSCIATCINNDKLVVFAVKKMGVYKYIYYFYIILKKKYELNELSYYSIHFSNI